MGNTGSNGVAQDASRRTKPTCKLIGTDGNVFAITGRVRRALIVAGMDDVASEFVRRAFRSRSYDEVLALYIEYVRIPSSTVAAST